MHVDVWVVRMDEGRQATATEVMLAGTATVTVDEPDLLASCVEVAVMVAVPAPEGVRTPPLVIVPAVEGETDQETAEL